LLYFSFQLAGNGNRSPYNFCDFTILSDSASTPTSIRHTTQLTTQTNVDETTGSLVYVYFSYFVKKGEYYTVRQRNVGAGADRYITSTVRYIKLEIGN
jgi:hypothetical protein